MQERVEGLRVLDVAGVLTGVLAEQVTEDEEVRNKMLLALSLIRPLDFILNVWRVSQGFLLCPCFLR